MRPIRPATHYCGQQQRRLADNLSLWTSTQEATGRISWCVADLQALARLLELLLELAAHAPLAVPEHMVQLHSYRAMLSHHKPPLLHGPHMCKEAES